jgi:segregation and condensation protein B
VEALLFSSERPMSVNDISTCLSDEKKSNITEALKSLQALYDELDRSFVLREVAGGYQFRTKSRYAPYILSMLKSSPARLSRAALETLAIIAYKQPIMRQEIERLRGVDVGGIIRTLMEKDLVRIMGRKKLPGRPLIYGTTNKFLEVFNLENLNCLPKLKEIKEFSSPEEGVANQAGQDGEQAGQAPLQQEPDGQENDR